jgi:hypothetical protein
VTFGASPPNFRSAAHRNIFSSLGLIFGWMKFLRYFWKI